MSTKYGDHGNKIDNLESQILKENEIIGSSENEKEDSLSKRPIRRTKEDAKNIVLIFLLYVMQGIPFGLLMGLPLILSSRKVSYADQGTLSFASWPYALKILWAPFVDSFYIERLGRRKTWIVTVQFCLGIVSFTSGSYLSQILNIDWVRNSQDILMLMLIFFVISFLNATHDIVMDGWAIDLLLKENVSWQATCNSIGMISGGFIGNALFILLESEAFCNSKIRPLFNLPSQKTGILDIKTFLRIYGSAMFIIACFILAFKSERNSKKSSEQVEKRSIWSTYKLIWKLMCKPQIRRLIFVFLTIRIGFSTEMIIRLRLIEEGVEKEKITILGVMLSPLLILLPVLLNKYMHGPKPLNLVLDTYGFKLIVVLIYTMFVVLTPYIKNEDSSLPLYYYAIYFLINVISASFGFIFYVSIGSFNSQISDKTIGGTYMTFLTLWLSIGSSVTKTSVLYLTNFFTYKYCFVDSLKSTVVNGTSIAYTAAYNSTASSNLSDLYNNKCSSDALSKLCVSGGGVCLKYFDGFYLLTFISVTIGFIWLIFNKKIMAQLQSIPKSDWLISK